MELNKVIKIQKGQPFNVYGMPRTHRILFSQEEGEIIIKCDAARAQLENIERGGRALVLSPSKAVQLFPEIFVEDDGGKTIWLNLSSEMVEFCEEQGDVTTFIRKLIEQAMK